MNIKEQRKLRGLVTVEEACAAAGITSAQLNTLRKRGDMAPPAHQCGAFHYYHLDDVERMKAAVARPKLREGLFNITEAARALHTSIERVSGIASQVPRSVKRGARTYWTAEDLEQLRAILIRQRCQRQSHQPLPEGWYRQTELQRELQIKTSTWDVWRKKGHIPAPAGFAPGTTARAYGPDEVERIRESIGQVRRPVNGITPYSLARQWGTNKEALAKLARRLGLGSKHGTQRFLTPDEVGRLAAAHFSAVAEASVTASVTATGPVSS